MTRIEPNPHSPYATADPNSRHLLPVPLFFPEPKPGSLAVTGCRELAVAPDKLSDTNTTAELPDGLCPACVTAMTTGTEPDPRPTTDCAECGQTTEHNGLCAVCRMDMHDQWRAA